MLRKSYSYNIYTVYNSVTVLTNEATRCAQAVLIQEDTRSGVGVLQILLSVMVYAVGLVMNKLGVWAEQIVSDIRSDSLLSVSLFPLTHLYVWVQYSGLRLLIWVE